MSLTQLRAAARAVGLRGEGLFDEVAARVCARPAGRALVREATSAVAAMALLCRARLIARDELPASHLCSAEGGPNADANPYAPRTQTSDGATPAHALPPPPPRPQNGGQNGGDGDQGGGKKKRNNKKKRGGGGGGGGRGGGAAAGPHYGGAPSRSRPLAASGALR